jgi:cell wall-associated NlpC family hydrolase
MRRCALLGTIVAVTLIAAAGCASSGVSPRPFPTPPAAGPTPPEPSVDAAPTDRASGDGYAIASFALRLQGAPYRPGGADPQGFDCSGLVQYVFGSYGIGLPRVVAQQFQVGRGVSLDDLEPGDLVFFATDGHAASHVGIVVGGDRFVHAPNTRGVVRIDSLTSGYWGERVVGARRME